MHDPYETVNLRYGPGTDVKVEFDDATGRVTVDLSKLKPSVRNRIKNILLGGVGPGPPPCMVLNAKCERTIENVEIRSIERQVLNDLDAS